MVRPEIGPDSRHEHLASKVGSPGDQDNAAPVKAYKMPGGRATSCASLGAHPRQHPTDGRSARRGLAELLPDGRILDAARVGQLGLEALHGLEESRI